MSDVEDVDEPLSGSSAHENAPRSRDAPNTKFASVPYPIPREPRAYEATIHFGQRLKERVPPADRNRAVRDTIRFGTLRGAADPPELARPEDVCAYFQFDGEEWTIVVGIVPEAVWGDRKHRAITIYEREGDG